jgi:protein-S-isoprenylcysteine O-methyltransferase Ste14
MATIALVILGLTFALGFGLRVLVQWRRTGSTGVRVFASGASRAERLAVGTLGLATVVAALAPVLQLDGDLGPIPALDIGALQAFGVALGVAGCGLIFVAQLAMGDSWRIGVDTEERTKLVTDGLFGLVRNPVYSMVALTYLGLVLMLGSALIIAGLLVLLVGLQIQVRAVEEPYLLEVHGDEYAAYASRVGRFAPGVGIGSPV